MSRRDPIHVPGALVSVRIGKVLYVRVDTTLADFGGTLADMGKILGLSPDTIVDAIVSEAEALREQNEWAIGAIFESEEFWLELRQFREAGERARTVAEKRALIRQGRKQLLLWWSDRKDKGVGPGMYRWAVPRGKLLLPQSTNLRKLVDKSQRHQVTVPSTSILDTLIDELALTLDRLSEALVEIGRVGDKNMAEVGGLMAMSSLSDVLIEHAEPGKVRDNISRFKEFIDTSAVPLAVERLVVNPVDLTSACKVRDAMAEKVLDLLAREAFVTLLRITIDNRDVVDPHVHARAYLHLERASMLLSRTSAAERFVDQEVLPAMRAFERVKSKSLTRILAQIEDDAARAFYTSGWVDGLPSKSSSAFAVALAADGIMINTATNVEGPMALGVAVFAIHGARLLAKFSEKLLTQPGEAVYSAAVIRGLIAYGEGRLIDRLNLGKHLIHIRGKPSVHERAAIIEQLCKKQLADVAFRSPTARGFSAVLITIALLGAIETGRKDGFSSPEAVLQVIAASTSAGIAIADLAPLAKLLERKVGKTAIEMTTRQLASFVALVGIAITLMQLEHDIARGDSFAATIDYFNLAGGSAGLISWIVLDAAYTAELIGGKLWRFGHYAALVAAVLLVAAGAAQIYIAVQASKGPEAFMNAILAGLDSDSKSVEGESAMRRAGLDDTIATLRAAADACVFSRLPEKARSELVTRGFDDVAIRLIMAD